MARRIQKPCQPQSAAALNAEKQNVRNLLKTTAGEEVWRQGAAHTCAEKSECPMKRALSPDRQLEIAATLIADGATCHKVREELTLYRCAAELFNRTGQEVWLILFERRERNLRRLIVAGRLRRHG